MRPYPPVLRALKYAEAKLKGAGVKVVDWAPLNHQEGFDILSALYFPDAAKTQKDILAEGGEPIDFLTTWAFGLAKPEPLSLAENWEMNVRRENYREA